MMKRVTNHYYHLFPTLILPPQTVRVCACPQRAHLRMNSHSHVWDQLQVSFLRHYPLTFWATRSLLGLEITDYARLTGQWVSVTFLPLPLQCWDYKRVKYVSLFLFFFLFLVLGIETRFPCLHEKHFADRVSYLLYQHQCLHFPVTCFKTEGADIISQDPCLFSKSTTFLLGHSGRKTLSLLFEQSLFAVTSRLSLRPCLLLSISMNPQLQLICLSPPLISMEAISCILWPQLSTVLCSEAPWKNWLLS